jgi:hypothetical protein
MNTPKTCPQCGDSLPGNAVRGLCPKCLALLVFPGEGTKTILVQPISPEAPQPPLQPTPNYFGDYAEPVHYAHQRGTLHRDRELNFRQRPSNILMPSLQRLTMTAPCKGEKPISAMMKRFLAALVFSVFLNAAFAETFTWTGKAENGDWDTPMNWDPSDRAPENGDNVIINNSGVTLNVNLTLASLDITNSLLNGDGAIEVTAQSSFAYTTFGLAGGILVSAATDIYPAADVETTFQCSLTNSDTASVTVHGNAWVVVDSGFVIVNEGTWIFTSGSSLSLVASDTGSATFINTGSLFLTNAAIYARESSLLNSSGASIYAFQTNNFEGGFNSSGTLQAAANSFFNIDSSSQVNLETAANFSGAGVTAISCPVGVDGTAKISGTLQFLGSSIVIDGVLDVASGGVFNWSGGRLTANEEGAFALVIVDQGGLLNIINNQNQLALSDVLLTNAGTVNWSGLGTLFLSEGAVILNDGLFNISGDGTLAPPEGDESKVAFINEAQVKKTAGATNGPGTSIEVSFLDTNMTEVQQGNLQFSAGGTIANWTVDSGASLDLLAGTFTANPEATVASRGETSLEEEATIEIPDSQTLTINGNFYQEGGTVSGGGALYIAGGTFPGVYEWDGGTISISNLLKEAVVVEEGGTMNIEGPYQDKNLLDGELLNEGVINWVNDNDVGGISLGDYGQIVNHGAFNLQCDAYMSDTSTNTNSAPVFYNQLGGTVAKTAKTATTVFALKFFDAGTIVAQSGIIEFVNFADNYPNLPRPKIILEGGTIQFDNLLTLHADISGSGQINAPKGLVLSGGELTVIVIIFDGDITDDELFDLSAYSGVITFAGGSFTQTANGTLVVPVQSTNANGGYGKISNPRSTVTLGGTLKVVLTNGYAPPVGASFPFLNGGQLINTFSNLVLPEGMAVTYTGNGASIVVTNPTPVMIAVGPAAGGQFQFDFDTVPGRGYTVELATNLNNPAWTVVTNFVALSTNFSLTFPASSSPEGFIRVVEP